MKLDGVHHVTAITADAPQNVDFYTRVLGMRLVKKTVNQDDPGVYHLFYGDEAGSPGFDITFFEYPGVRRGRDGDGMVHTIAFRVPSSDALDFWAERLGGEGIEVARDAGADAIRFADPEGLGLEFRVEDVPDAPLVAALGDVPPEHAVIGFAGVRAYSSNVDRSRPLLTGAMAMEAQGEGVFEARGEERGGWISYDAPPAEDGVPGAGTVHHVAWSIPLGAQDEWRSRVVEAGARATEVIDRFYFRSIYFREPSGVLFELATRGPGFTADEELEHLGEKVALPPFLERQRARIEAALTPLPPVPQRAESR